MGEERPRSFRNLRQLKQSVADFFGETTIHGVAHIAQGRNFIETVLWVIFTIFSFVCAGIVIYDAFGHWEKYPVQTTIDEVSVTSQDLPFPAVTVCDTESLQMPRRNRWMFVEKFLNAVQLKSPDELTEKMYPGRTVSANTASYF